MVDYFDTDIGPDDHSPAEALVAFGKTPWPSSINKFVTYATFLIAIAGCSHSEKLQCEILNTYKLDLQPKTNDLSSPKEIKQVVGGAKIATEKIAERGALSPQELETILKFLTLCKQLLGYEGERLNLAITETVGKSCFHQDTIYLSSQHYANGYVKECCSYLAVLMHEFGHALSVERPRKTVADALLNPEYWVQDFPSEKISEEIRAETTVTLLMFLFMHKTGEHLFPELTFHPLQEEPEIWNYLMPSKAIFWSATENNPLLKKLKDAHTYADLKNTIYTSEDEKYRFMRLCLMILEPHYKTPNDFWNFLYTCDDKILEGEINLVLSKTSALDALKHFVEHRKKIFTATTQ